MAKKDVKVVETPEKAIKPADLIEVKLKDGSTLELEDLTGRKTIRLARALGKEAVRIGVIIREDSSESTIAEIILTELDDERLEEVVKVLFDGHDVLSLRAVDIMSIVEQYLEAVEIAEVFQLGQQIVEKFKTSANLQTSEQ